MEEATHRGFTLEPSMQYACKWKLICVAILIKLVQVQTAKATRRKIYSVFSLRIIEAGVIRCPTAMKKLTYS